jgi:hypothetical protein
MNIICNHLLENTVIPDYRHTRCYLQRGECTLPCHEFLNRKHIQIQLHLHKHIITCTCRRTIAADQWNLVALTYSLFLGDWEAVMVRVHKLVRFASRLTPL